MYWSKSAEKKRHFEQKREQKKKTIFGQLEKASGSMMIPLNTFCNNLISSLKKS